MNIHVFVVNQITFKQHLEYMFAGTGAKNRMSLFLEKSANYRKEFSWNDSRYFADKTR